MKWEKWFGNFQVNTSRYRFRWGKFQDKYKGIPCWAFSVGKAMKSLVSYAKWKRVDQPQSQNHIKLLLNPNGSYLPMGLIVFIFPLEALVVPKPKCIDKIHFRLSTAHNNQKKLREMWRRGRTNFEIGATVKVHTKKSRSAHATVRVIRNVKFD